MKIQKLEQLRELIKEGWIIWMPAPAEYEIELINQNTVTLKSNDHNRTWTTTPDSIVYYLELDNL